MGHSFKSYYDKGVEILTKQISAGMAELSLDLHGFISSLVYTKKENSNLDRPFDTIGDAFNYAFSLGYLKGGRIKVQSPKKDIGVRSFRPELFKILLEQECISDDMSIGALISEYAEYGATQIKTQLDSGGNILQLLNEST